VPSGGKSGRPRTSTGIRTIESGQIRRAQAEREKEIRSAQKEDGAAMSDLDEMPHEPEQYSFPAAEQPSTRAEGAPELTSEIWDSTPSSPEPAVLFQPWPRPEIAPPSRIPHLGHLALLAALAAIGLFCATVLAMVGIHFHLFGVTTIDQTATEVHYELGSEAILYLVTLALGLILFPLFWKKSFFAGIQWRGETALELGWRLPAISLGCFVLAAIDMWLLPGPENAPIDEMFRVPGAAWLLFAFGVTVAPFFEEIFFRGFLLPAFSTAFDWIAERTSGNSVLLLDAGGRPRWSARSILAASIGTGIPAAVVCAGPIGQHAVGNILLLALWSLSAALIWMLADLRPSARSDRFDSVDANGHPQWSIPAMVFASLASSLPFAMLHGEQTGYSVGPLLQVFAVSLILCAVRLKTRSLAASTMVHAGYNLLIFSLMMIGTGGFRHLDKM
jgi:membrane protease YdiL (CAAX protease family)